MADFGKITYAKAKDKLMEIRRYQADQVMDDLDWDDPAINQLYATSGDYAFTETSLNNIINVLKTEDIEDSNDAVNKAFNNKIEEWAAQNVPPSIGGLLNTNSDQINNLKKTDNPPPDPATDPASRIKAIKSAGTTTEILNSGNSVTGSYETASIPQGFYDNLFNAVNLPSARAGSTREDEFLQIRPKPELVAKLFILPEWSKQDQADPSYSTTDFALLQVQEQEAEKYQIIETFGNDVLYFYGKRPSVYSFAGNLLNTNDYQWKNNFYEDYKTTLRGTKCAENKSRAYMFYDDVIVEGYILNMSMSMNASETKVVPFSFTMYVTNQIRINTASLDKVTPAQSDFVNEKILLKKIMNRYGNRELERDKSIEYAEAAAATVRLG